MSKALESKLSISHFLYYGSGKDAAISLGVSGAKAMINGTPSKLNAPLYIKVIFKRNVTQIRSIVGEYFYTVKDAYEKYDEILNAELKMVEHYILTEYKKRGGKFKLAGVSSEFKNIHKIKIGNVFNHYLYKDFDKYLSESKNKYASLLQHGIGKVPAEIYFEGTMKLIGNDTALLRFRRRFEITSVLEKFVWRGNDLSDAYVIEWRFGDIKEKLSLYAIKKSISFDEIRTFINCVDKIISIE